MSWSSVSSRLLDAELADQFRKRCCFRVLATLHRSATSRADVAHLSACVLSTMCLVVRRHGIAVDRRAYPAGEPNPGSPSRDSRRSIRRSARAFTSGTLRPPPGASAEVMRRSTKPLRSYHSRMRRSGAQEATVSREVDEQAAELQARTEREIDLERQIEQDRELDLGFGIE